MCMCKRVQSCLRVRTYGKSCVPALMQACVHTYKCVKIMHEHMCGWICLRVCACTNVDKESLSVSLKPRGSRGQLAASCSRQPARCLGILQACSPRALELTSGGYQSDKQAEQCNKRVCSLLILCSVWL